MTTQETRLLVGYEDDPKIERICKENLIGKYREGAGQRACTNCKTQVWLGPRQLKECDSTGIIITCTKCLVKHYGIGSPGISARLEHLGGD